MDRVAPSCTFLQVFFCGWTLIFACATCATSLARMIFLSQCFTSEKNISMQVAIVDLEGALFPFSGRFPTASRLLTWRELAKVDFERWLPQRVEEINALHAFPTSIFIKSTLALTKDASPVDRCRVLTMQIKKS